MRSLVELALTLLIESADETPSANIQAKEEDPVMRHLGFPIVEGTYKMTKDWSVVLPSQFNRRIEDGDLVIWKPGFTLWITVWNNDKSETQEERLAWIQGDSSAQAFDEITESSDGLMRYAYRLREESEDDREPAFYCFAIGSRGHVQMAIYFDAPDNIADAMSIWRSLNEQ